MDPQTDTLTARQRGETIGAAATRPGRFEGKTVLVTGASSGIGQALAVAFAREGARVAVNHRGDLDGAEATLRMAHAARGDRSRVLDDLLVEADVSDAEAVEKMFDVLDDSGGLDILVNNAGVQIEAPTHESDLRAFDLPIAVNLRGPFLCSRRAIQGFRARGTKGTIINISSVHEEIPKPLFAGYSASKGGLRNLTRTLALEYAAEGIRVNAVAPGAIVTPINEDWIDDPERRRQVESHIPLGRAGTPEEVAHAVLWLASDEARYVTGQTLFVDGGLTLYPEFRTPWSS